MRPRILGRRLMATSIDSKPVNADELHSFEKILNACWRTFAKSVKTAEGKSLRTGPRGGGRQVEGIVGHVLESKCRLLEFARLKFPERPSGRSRATAEELFSSAVRASARGEIPAKGPRGGSAGPRAISSAALLAYSRSCLGDQRPHGFRVKTCTARAICSTIVLYIPRPYQKLDCDYSSKTACAKQAENTCSL